MWRTPDASMSTGGASNAENRKKQGHAISLADQVNTPTMWPTPTARDRGNRGPSEAQRKSPALNHLATDGNGGSLNPTWVEWLMNWPISWTSLEPMKNEYFRDWQKKGAAVVSDNGERHVRLLWWSQDPSETPYRPQSDEQRAGQRGVSVRGLSCNGTQETRSGEMRDMRQQIPTETKAQFDTMRFDDMPQREGEIISRVAVGITARADRLKAIGNGQVPQCAAAAWRLLTETGDL